MLLDTLNAIRCAEEIGTLFAEIGYVPDRIPVKEGVTVVARWKGFKVFAADSSNPLHDVRAMARSLAGISARGLAVAVRAPNEIALAAPRLGAPGISRVLVVPLQDPSTEVLQHLRQFRPKPSSNGLTHALRVQELLATEIVGERFYASFRLVLDRMAASFGKVATPRDRRLAALLSLTRVLFLYFVQAKGWLDNKSDYLRSLLDDALAANKHFHSESLNPLFFETLNRPIAARKGVSHLGQIPYLNGGLFQAHPVERKLRPSFANALWRDAFEGLFDKFRFCVREADEVDAIAPDMLGRVFERVMETDARHDTGTFYTPERVVREIVIAAIETALMGNGRLTSDHVSRIVRAQPIEQELRATARDQLRRLRILDPAVGSGAFLLGALEELGRMHRALRSDRSGTRQLDLRRRILHENLFGVDINPVAVRLAELRLWLAVIADDPCSEIDAIEPLPNLDGLVRQGDSLLDPIAAASMFAMRPLTPTQSGTRRVFHARTKIFAARGKQQQTAGRQLYEAEEGLARELLERALANTEHAIKDLTAAARGRDLFGRRSGLTSQQQRIYRMMRAHRKTLKRVLVAVGEGAIPFFSYEIHMPDIMRNGGFSVVIGNPPWVRAERLPAATRRTLKERFSWWRGVAGKGYAHLPDLSIAFLQRALELTKAGGSVGFLMPSKLTTSGYAQTTRSSLVSETTVQYLHRVPDQEAAQFGATTYPLAIILKNESPDAKHQVRLGFNSDSRVKQRSLHPTGPWILVPDRARRALDDLRNAGTPLGVVAPPALGVKTGADAIFVGETLEASRSVSTVRFGSTVAAIESTLLRPVIRGRDIRRFKATSTKVVLWGYDAHGDPLERLPPLAAVYIASHRRALVARADYGGGPLWTLFRLGTAGATHRVIWPDITKTATAVLLNYTATRAGAAIPLNSCYVSVAPDRDTGLAICAVMNSTLIRALVFATADEARGGYRRVNARIASQVPVPPLDASRQLIRMSAGMQKGDTFDQSKLDTVVAEALGLPPTTRDILCRLAPHHG